MTLADFVRQQRKNYKLTQKDLAERSGVGIRFIRELEGGKATLRMDKVNTVLDLFGAQLGVVQIEGGE
jgi:y4mF family transcriptional regulator